MCLLCPILLFIEHQENSTITSGESEKAIKGIDLLSFEANTADIVQLNLALAVYATCY
jgi:hypothetical protein